MATLRIVPTPIDHALFCRARKLFGQLVNAAPPGSTIALIGATQSGKTLILDAIFEDLMRSIDQTQIDLVPYLKQTVQSTQEGRAKTKWLVLQLMKRLRHPVYKHVGELDEMNHYIPHGYRSEEQLRTSLDPALDARGVIRTLLDEAHLLTRTKDVDLRASLLESLKSCLSIERALVLCGGYELAYRGMYDSAHFAGRSIVCDFGYYRSDNESDFLEWRLVRPRFRRHLIVSFEDRRDYDQQTFYG